MLVASEIYNVQENREPKQRLPEVIRIFHPEFWKRVCGSRKRDLGFIDREIPGAWF